MSFLDELQTLAQEVAKTPTDIKRLENLPQRTYTPEDTQRFIQEYTARLKTPQGTMTLWPTQAMALHDATQAKGFVGFVRTAGGKSLISLLIPMVVPCHTAVVLVPPSLKTKLIDSDYVNLSKHWQLPNLANRYFISAERPTIHPVAYSELSSKKDADVLERIRPDIIVADEAHALTADGWSARKTRFRRYFKSAPQTRLYTMSGTLLRKSVLDLAPLLKMCLREGSPMPFDFNTLLSWAAVLDPKDRRAQVVESWRDVEARKELERLSPQPGLEPREVFQKRLFSTPGVVASEGRRECDAGLLFHERKLKTPAEVVQKLQELRTKWQLDEEIFSDKIQLSRAARQLACGLYTRWKWPRNEPLQLRTRWLLARKEYHREERDFLQNRSKSGVDSPLLVKNALVKLQAPNFNKKDTASILLKETALQEAWALWQKVEPTCKPEEDVVWVSDYLVKDAVEWGKKNVGLIWTWHRALGPRIATEGGFPYYGDTDDAAALLKEDGSRTIVLSANAFSAGQNLQAYSKQLLTSTTGNAVTWQQLLSRTHRDGQKADNIETWVYRHTPELIDAWNRARTNASFAQEVTKDEQLLLLGTCSWVEDVDMNKSPVT